MDHRYRKRPVVIEAFQMTEERWRDRREWPEWLHVASRLPDAATGSIYRSEWTPRPPGDEVQKTFIGTLEGELVVSPDDWIIQGVEGEIYPCKGPIFQKTYEPVDTVGSPISRLWRRLTGWCRSESKGT